VKKLLCWYRLVDPVNDGLWLFRRTYYPRKYIGDPTAPHRLPLSFNAQSKSVCEGVLVVAIPNCTVLQAC